MIQIAVCDDETYYTDKIQNFLFHQSVECEVNIFHSGKSFLDSGKDYDIIFMDIELPDCNGIKLLRKYNFSSIIIIFTSHKEEILNGYYIRAFRFLLKPIDDLLIYEAFFNAVNELKKQIYIEVVDENRNRNEISLDKIVYIEAGDKRSGVRTLSKFYYSNLPINKLKVYLNANFYFVHRSYIINMNYIDKLNVKDKTVVMRENSIIAVSRLKWKEFRDRFYKYIKVRMQENN